MLGRTIVCVATSTHKLRAPLPQSRLQALKGNRFVGVCRRGKYLILELDSQKAVLVHLGMTGQLVFRLAGDKHDHVVFEFDAGSPLVFNDPRRFGMVLVFDSGDLATCPYLANLGVDLCHWHLISSICGSIVGLGNARLKTSSWIKGLLSASVIFMPTKPCLALAFALLGRRADSAQSVSEN